MKASYLLSLAVCCLLATNADAQKKKNRKKDANKVDSVDLSKFSPPRIVKDEDVSDVGMPAQEAVAPPPDISEASISNAPYSYDAPKTNSYAMDVAPVEDKVEISDYNAPAQKSVFDKKGKYNLVFIGGSYYSEAKYGIADTSGKTILPIVFKEIKNTDDGVIVKLGKLYGLLDNDFNVLIPVEYDYFSPVKGRKCFIVGSTYGGKRLVDRTGKQLVPGDFYNIYDINSSYSNGADTAQCLSFSKKSYGSSAIYSLAEKKFMTDFTIISSERFDGGFVLKESKGTRIYDRKFKPLTNEVYDQVSNADYRALIVTIKNKKGLLSNAGKYILPCEYDAIESTNSYSSSVGAYIARKGTQAFVVDYLGKNLLGEVFDAVTLSSAYQSNHLLVKKGTKTGVKDILNHTILPIEFDTIYYVNAKYIAKKGDKLSAYSTSTGTLLNTLDYNKIEDLNSNYKLYYKNNKAGLMSSYLEILTEPLYDKIELMTTDYYYSSSSSDDRFRVTSSGKIGIISKTTTIVPAIYDNVVKLLKETYLVRLNGKYGLINGSSRKIIAPCKYDFIGQDGYSEYRFICVEGNTSTIVSTY
ncbi:WG repeat-containing protein [Ferruginibacter sp. SUN002]|uniref:WG repeat-containing protein n=1 Tax=Ferruginibacter sp. SUN002 TaxID=2937789 RepID=UPI003D35F74F